ncbi:Desmethyl-deoxy-podophyllotoxin synthase [Linum perenne]
MDLTSSSSSFSFLVLLLTFILILRNRNKNSKLPPGPWKLPIIGNLHQLIGDQPHRRLKDLAAKYGPDIMHIQLGELSHIVVSSQEAAKLVYKTHGLAFASRPSMLALRVIGKGSNGIAFAPYGEDWRHPKRVMSFRHIREEVVSDLVRSLNGDGNKVVDLSSLVNKLSSSVTSRASFGTVPELSSEAFLMIMDNMSNVLSGFQVSDLYPSLKLLPYLTGFRAKLEKMHEASDLILDEIIDQHRSNRRGVNKDDDNDDSEKEDLVDVLLNLQESQNCGVHISMDVIKAIVMEMFLGGSESSSATIEWVISEIINDQRVLQTVQEEVRQVFNEEARLGELKYLDMAISESMRLHPPGPLLNPRENQETVKLSNGYEIPAKTTVIVNVWAINRDPRYWKEPEKFYPERFADSSIDYKGNCFEFIPFGAGRRICPGISFAMVIIKLALANLFFHFDWRLPANLESTGLDMTEVFGLLTLKRKHPLCLIPVPHKIE